MTEAATKALVARLKMVTGARGVVRHKECGLAGAVQAGRRVSRLER